MQELDDLMKEVGIDAVIVKDEMVPIIAGCAAGTTFYVNDETRCESIEDNQIA